MNLSGAHYREGSPSVDNGHGHEFFERGYGEGKRGELFHSEPLAPPHTVFPYRDQSPIGFVGVPSRWNSPPGSPTPSSPNGFRGGRGLVMRHGVRGSDPVSNSGESGGQDKEASGGVFQKPKARRSLTKRLEDAADQTNDSSS